MIALSWGRCLDRWHDERPTLHILRGDGAPACGVKYYTTGGQLAVGPTPGKVGPACRRCLRLKVAREAAT
jgi:hypothetical protein